MNSRAKGNRNEVKAVKELEKDAWIVYRVKGSTMFNKNVDMFGLWDLCAKKGMLTRWIQVKTNKKPCMNEFEHFAAHYCSPYESVEVWVYKDRKGCTKHVVKNNDTL